MEEPEINLTPLIDVVFVILIMFIVIAPLLDMDRIELAESAEGSTKKTSVQDQGPVSIHVFHDNSIKYNSQDVNIQQLQLLLKQAKGQHPEARPQLFQDKKAQFGTYQSVKNAAEIAGFEEMDIVLNPG